MTNTTKLVYGTVLTVGALAVVILISYGDSCAQLRRDYLKYERRGLRTSHFLLPAHRLGCGWAQGVD